MTISITTVATGISVSWDTVFCGEFALATTDREIASVVAGLVTTGHDVTCVARQIAEARFYALHPNACRRCGGTGWVGGHGQDYWSGEPDGDVCGQCIDHGRCPRCGEATLDEDGNVCEAAGCGWSYETDSEGAPDPDCCCYELEEQADLEMLRQMAQRRDEDVELTSEELEAIVEGSDAAYELWNARQRR